ncbi:MAG: transposase, partial [Cyclobacteriaceae bacterium]|nr:transposase [Cyclobacteriaceae bacterium]
QVWQQEYHPVELGTNEMMEQRLDYLHENPVKEGWVDNPQDYLYSSARDYAGRKGLLDIMFVE